MTTRLRTLLGASLIALSTTPALAEDGNDHSQGATEAASFEGWEGTWQSVDGIMAHPAMIPVAETIASQAESWTTSNVRN